LEVNFKIRFWAPAVLAAGVLFSCESNELEKVLKFSDFETPPTRSTTDVVYTFTDSGRVQNKLEAGQVDQFQSPDSTYSLLSNGFKLTFFTNSGNFDGRLTARNGWISGDNSKMIARDSVIFVNRDGETLHTEELTWVQDSAKVFTDKFVTIEREDNTIYGKGMVSDQNFTNYVINEVTGVIYIDEESK
jgi:LPS export ABC transporter protein LptC